MTDPNDAPEGPGDLTIVAIEFQGGLKYELMGEVPGGGFPNMKIARMFAKPDGIYEIFISPVLPEDPKTIDAKGMFLAIEVHESMIRPCHQVVRVGDVAKWQAALQQAIVNEANGYREYDDENETPDEREQPSDTVAGGAAPAITQSATPNGVS